MTREDIARIDRAGMYAAVRGFPDQLLDGRRRALSADLSGIRRGAQAVVVAGMGGSAIGGDLLRTLAASRADVPIVVSRSYALPAWVGPTTTVVACSYSGNTEETLSALDEAARRGASVVCITTGGAMAERARRRGLPLVTLPAGLQPRAALGYSLTALLAVSERLGLVAIPPDDWDEAAAVTKAMARESEDPADPGNEAMRLAESLNGLFPVVYSSARLEGACLRWRNQMHENGKTFAVGNLLPEMNHNEIMGWARGGAELKSLAVIVLRDEDDHERVQRRMDVSRELLEPAAAFWTEIHSRGRSPLARLLSLLYASDWVSLYLALLHEVDPSPVGLISRLKAALAEPTA